MQTVARKFSMYKFGVALCSVVTLAGLAAVSHAETLVNAANFDEASMPAGWTIGAQSGGSIGVTTDVSKTLNGSTGSLKASYPVSSGGVYAWATYNVSKLNTRDLYMDFWAKMPSAKQGLKFLKIFGSTSGGSNNYANTTFALDYTGRDPGSMYQVSFGDGSGAGNDTANVINFDGSNPEWIGRSYGRASVSTPAKKAWASSNWGTGWHHFRIHVKFNSGTTAQTEVPDGEYYVEIDGVVYVDAKGLFNRNYTNGPIDRVELYGWAQNGNSPFELWYDDVKITTGGFVGQKAPNPPVLTVGSLTDERSLNLAPERLAMSFQ